MKKSYERRAYESVDDRSFSWIVCQKSTETEFLQQRDKSNNIN